MTPIAALKIQLREEAKIRRDKAACQKDIGEDLRKNFEQVFQLSPENRVSGYYPIGSEANVLPLLCAIGARGFETALPVVSGREDPLTFRIWNELDPSGRGPFGIPEPLENAKEILPDLILAPLLAFDRSGNRLGYGGGYYDRTITATRRRRPALAIGIAYAAQEVRDVPHDDGDVALDWIITEKEAIAAGRGNE